MQYSTRKIDDRLFVCHVIDGSSQVIGTGFGPTRHRAKTSARNRIATTRIKAMVQRHIAIMEKFALA